MPKMYTMCSWDAEERNPQRLQSIVQEMVDDNLMEDSEENREAAAILFTGIFVGHDHIHRIADFSGVVYWKARLMTQRLRQNGIWRKDGLIMMETEEEDGGCIEFILHMLVAQGKIKRVPPDKWEQKS